MLDKLTPRERTIAVLVSSGLTNKQISHQLITERRTVDNHVSSIYRKFELRREDGCCRVRLAIQVREEILWQATAREANSFPRK